MSIGECPNPDPECPYYDRAPPSKLEDQEHGCFSDTHHTYPVGQMALGGIARKYALLHDNTEQLCRWEHDEIHAEYFLTGEFPPLPDLEIMKEALNARKKK